MWILSKIRFWKCEYLEKFQIFAPVWSNSMYSPLYWWNQNYLIFLCWPQASCSEVLMHFYETFYHQKNLFCSMLTREVHISSKPKPRLESDWCISFREVAVCFLILCVVMQNRIFFCTEKWEERVWRKCYPSTRKFGCGPFDVKKRARVFLH